VGDDVRALGGAFVHIAPGADPQSEGIAVPLPTGLTEGAYALLALPFVQLLALHQAEALGLHPDHPRHLGRVVTLSAAEAG
jgi:fructoselysine-6-P-deglycase FrlB-like protein